MTVLVTGASGFLGAALVEALAGQGRPVLAAVRNPAAQARAAHENVRYVPFDLARTDADLAELLDPVTTVYHLAWSSLPASSDADPVGDASENIVGTLRMLTALRGRDVRFVFASSGGTVYGAMRGPRALETDRAEPSCAYGMSKLAVEGYLDLFGRLRNLDHVSLRIANPYGPRQSGVRNFGAVATFARRALDGQPITIWGDGETVRDYVFLDDVVEAFVAAGAIRGGQRVINVGSGEGRSLNDLVAAIGNELGSPLDVRYEPARGFDIRTNVLDTALGESALGWRARTPFSLGLSKTINALRTAA